jgi:hypothetical protein
MSILRGDREIAEVFWPDGRTVALLGNMAGAMGREPRRRRQLFSATAPSALATPKAHPMIRSVTARANRASPSSICIPLHLPQNAWPGVRANA